jgi:glutathione reductase (NADPH)
MALWPVCIRRVDVTDHKFGFVTTSPVLHFRAMTDFNFDLFVIGSGSGGVRAARIAASYGAKVGIAEEFRMGGTCVIRGCVPKKLLVYASRFASDYEDSLGYGWSYGERTFNWHALIKNKNKETSRLEAVYTGTIERAGVTRFATRAVFEGTNKIKLVGLDKTVSAEKILIATGSTPYFGPAIPGIEYAISSNEALDLPHLPKSILVYGGGYIALEFACIFAALGSQVTLVCRSDNVLRGFDDDVREIVRTQLEGQKIAILSGRKVTSIAKDLKRLLIELSDGMRVDADEALFAIGRRPNVAGLGLEKAGVSLAGHGGIAVDKYSRTNVPSIFAVGDVTNRINLTPVAIKDGHAFADTEFGGKPRPIDHDAVATAVFSDPEVGCVGITESEARAKYNVDIYKTSFRPMKAMLAGRNNRSLMKLVVDADTELVLGCHIVGEGAAELIQMVAVAVKMNATKADLDRVVPVHPTAAEELVTLREKSPSRLNVSERRIA